MAKVCCRCKEDKEIEAFSLNRHRPDGRREICRQCQSEERTRRKGGLRGNNQHKKRDYGIDRVWASDNPQVVEAIVRHYLENPKSNYLEAAEKLQVSVADIKYVINHNDYLKALKALASKKMREMVPLAVNGMKESLQSENATVKFHSSVKVLEDAEIIGPQKVDIHVNNLDDLTVKQLNEIVERSKKDPIEQTIDAELVT